MTNKPDPRAPEIVARYLSGLNSAQVGREFGVNAETVRRMVRNAGGTMRSRWPDGPRPPAPKPVTPAAPRPSVVPDASTHHDHVHAVATALGGRGFPFLELRRAA